MRCGRAKVSEVKKTENELKASEVKGVVRRGELKSRSNKGRHGQVW